MVAGLREVETTYDVPETAALPALADLPDVARIDGPVTFVLEAHYFDTRELVLARRGITLRRRTGGHDEGWHLKLPVPGARQELQVPLGRSTRTPPLALRRILQAVVRDDPIVHVASLTTERTTVSLLDADESLLAELCDDRVAGRRIGPDGDDVEAWREWELEVHAARPRLARAVAARMVEAGGRVAAHQSKLGRVLQVDVVPPTPRHPRIRAHATEHELLAQRLSHLRGDLRRLDPAARADLPDAVHQLRVVLRTLRATLATFEVSLDTAVTDPVRDDLAWIGQILGRPRDLEVLQERLAALVAAQPPGLVRGRPGPWIDARLRAARRAAHTAALDAMATDRYFALVDTLDSWRTGPPWTDPRDRPADQRLPKALRHEWRRVDRAVALAEAATEPERPALLHDVRKAAKRARYAAETLRPVLGTEATRMAKAATRIQKVLGEHHDIVVAAEQVLALAEAARADGRDTFTFGILTARLEAERAEQEQIFAAIWERTRR